MNEIIQKGFSEKSNLFEKSTISIYKIGMKFHSKFYLAGVMGYKLW